MLCSDDVRGAAVAMILAPLVQLSFLVDPAAAAAPAAQPVVAAAHEQEITLVGCLSKAADGNYILTNATNARPDARSGGQATTGSTAVTAPTATGTAGKTTEPAGSGTSTVGKAWSLLGATDPDMHVGHQVQVTGRVVAADVAEHGRGDEPAEPAAAAPVQRGDGGAGSLRPQLHVRILTLIASNCSY